jgi:RHS repeat-associated protein
VTGPGAVTSGITGECMEDSGAGTTSGTKADINACDGFARQKFTAQADKTMRINGLCLDATGTADSSLVELDTCTSSGVQQWTAGPGGILVNAASGKCLTDPGGTTTGGTQLQVSACNGTTQQSWRLPATVTSMATNGITGECLEDFGAGTASGTKADINACDGFARQKFTLQAGGTITINGLCLAAAGTADSSLVELDTCTSGNAAQIWAVGPDGWVVNPASKKCLVDPGGTTTGGTQLQIFTCTTNPQQRWRMPAVLAPAGAVASGITGECMEDFGAGTTSGTKADINACDGFARQKFTIQDDETIRINGLCLDAAGTAASSLVELDSCTSGNAAQIWAVGPDGWVLNPTSGKCLTDPGGTTTSGTQLQISACNTTPQQDWTPPATTVPATPTSVTATAGTAAATLTWQPPTANGGSALTGYTITAAPGGHTATAGPDATTATIAGLTAGTAYTFTLTAASKLGSNTTSPTTAITPGNETTYTYDKAGNLTTSQTDGQTTTNTHNAAEELTQTVTGTTTTSYGYDADGNQTTAGQDTYTYNGAGELSQATTPAGTYAYTYDDAGNLTTTSTGGILLQGTTWDTGNPLPEAAEQTSPAGATTADLIDNPDGTLNALTQSGTTDNAITDWLGSVTGLVTSAGSQVTSTTYSPYGTPSTTGAPASPLGYAGSYNLPGSGGLDDMRARDYNPATAAFTSQDPLLSLTGQPYAYAGDPTTETDPSGACPSWLPCRAITFFEGAAQAGADLIARGAANFYDNIKGLAQTWYDNSCGGSNSGIFVTTPRGVTYKIPDGYWSEEAANGKGIVYRPLGSTNNEDAIRIMEPTARYPQGFVRIYNKYGQPVDYAGKPLGPAETHIAEEEIGPFPDLPLP